MKKTIGFILGLFCAASAWAQTVPAGSYDNSPAVFIQNEQLGSGAPLPSVTVGSELASYWGDGLYYVPGYYPGYPTAGVMWPRMVEVPCTKNQDGSLSCHGYSILAQQAGNRGEFILFKPVIQQPVVAAAPAAPVTIVVNSCCPKQEPLPVLKKKIRQ